MLIGLFRGSYTELNENRQERADKSLTAYISAGEKQRVGGSCGCQRGGAGQVEIALGMASELVGMVV